MLTATAKGTGRVLRRTVQVSPPDMEDVMKALAEEDWQIVGVHRDDEEGHALLLRREA